MSKPTVFKPGERVNVYSGRDNNAQPGVINNVDESGLFEISLDNGLRCRSHRKQIRKLKPKVKRKPREFWVNVYNPMLSAWCIHGTKAFADDEEASSNRKECIHVREVLPATDRGEK